jgi:hypothetical protein
MGGSGELVVQVRCWDVPATNRLSTQLSYHKYGQVQRTGPFSEDTRHIFFEKYDTVSHDQLNEGEGHLQYDPIGQGTQLIYDRD